jgi:glyoxylase-like metal-dependent hydrolase (beta-lactamase superfamily II)
VDDAAHLRWRIGDVTVTRVEERVIAIEPRYLVPGLTPEVVDPLREWCAPYVTTDGRMLLSVHAFVVVDGADTIVVDTCVGPHRDRPLPGDDSFSERLDAAIDGGLGAVTTVLCTHLHFDHVGWNTRRDGDRLVPTFPNANYLFGRRELEHLATDDQHRLREVAIAPVLDAGQGQLVETDHRVSPSVQLVPTPGHTPGHVSVRIESRGDRAIITGDCVHSPIQFRHPQLAAEPFDWDPARSTETRRALVGELADSGVLVLGTHFAPPTGGRVETGDDGAARFTP